MSRILIIDDSRFSRLKLSNNLKEAGFEIIEAGNGIEGLKAVQEQSPDAIICDLLMPEMDGIGFLEGMREKNINIPVLILTSDIQDKTREKVMEIGAVGLIHKPPKYEEVVRQLHQLIGERQC